MRTAPKLALSLIISSLLFAGLAAAAYAGLFGVLETKFYQPTVIVGYEERLKAISGGLSDWHDSNVGEFKARNNFV